MRRAPTEAERRLWAILRARRLAGYKFRRQVPIHPYIVDFACLAERLVVEADGGHHGAPRDERRDAWLAEQNFRVLHFWNNDVLANPDGVTETIISALDSPSPLAAEALGRGVDA